MISSAEAVAVMDRTLKLAREALGLVHSSPRQAELTLQVLVDGLDLTLRGETPGSDRGPEISATCSAAATYSASGAADLAEHDSNGEA